jgi:hypothetical protein
MRSCDARRRVALPTCATRANSGDVSWVGFGLLISVLVSAAEPHRCTACAKTAFPPDCPLLAPDRVHREIDDTCGVEGCPESSSPEATRRHAAQNRAKNNFCAKPPAIDLPADFALFEQLQSRVAHAKPRIDFGERNTLPSEEDRAKRLPSIGELARRPIGEGTLVRIAAYVRRAKSSDPESANCCSTKQPELNDIHLELVNATTKDECESVTAEMTPHWRPEAWATSNLPQLAPKPPLAPKKVPVRITGQLFFDASHRAPACHVKGQPSRLSSWEIHPVYQIEICKKGALEACDVSNDIVWEPLRIGRP